MAVSAKSLSTLRVAYIEFSDDSYVYITVPFDANSLSVSCTITYRLGISFSQKVVNRSTISSKTTGVSTFVIPHELANNALILLVHLIVVADGVTYTGTAALRGLISAYPSGSVPILPS